MNNQPVRKHKPLTTAQAIAWAGDAKSLATLLRVTVQAVHAWGEHPPIKRQRQIREMFEGKK
jgi:hypothetical protein